MERRPPGVYLGPIKPLVIAQLTKKPADLDYLEQVGVERYRENDLVRNGHIKRITDSDVELPVFEICGANIANNYIAFPAQKNASLKIKYPVLVLLVKNVKAL